MPRISGLGKNRNSQQEDSVEISSKSIKSSLKSFWRRRSSRTNKNGHEVIGSPIEQEKSSTLKREQSDVISSDCLRSSISAGNDAYCAPKTGYISNFKSVVSVGENTFGRHQSPRNSGRQVVSSLKQAMLIAGGLTENGFVPNDGTPLRFERSTNTFDNQGVSQLPRIPEHASSYTEEQIERLKSTVSRREHCRPNRSEFFSAPPGIYWPDVYPFGNVENTYDSANSRVLFPSSHVSHLLQKAGGQVSPFPRLSRYSTSSHHVHRSSANFSPPPPRLISLSVSPARSTSPVVCLNRPLPPTPYTKNNAPQSHSCEGIFKGFQSGECPSDIEFIDTVVYSNVHIPIRRVVSPATIEASLVQKASTRASPFSVGGNKSNISDENTPTNDFQALPSHDRLSQHRNHSRRIVSPVDRRRLSPIVHTSPSLVPATTGFPLGTNGINHHPCSPFAPIFRITPGGNTSPPAVSSRVGAISPCASQTDPIISCEQRPSEVCHCQGTKLALTPVNPALSSPNDVEFLLTEPNNSDPDVFQSQNPQATPSYFQSSHRLSSGRRDLVATYEEAWDVKMSRRLGGLDVSRLASTLQEPSFSSNSPGKAVPMKICPSPEITNAENCAKISSSSKEFRRFEACNHLHASDRSQITNGMGFASEMLSEPVKGPQKSSIPLRNEQSNLDTILTSTEEKTFVDRRNHKLTHQKGYRNSSTDAILHKEILPSSCQRKFGPDKKAHFLVTSSVDEESSCVSDEYTYAYDRSWSMGVQLNLLNNLSRNSESPVERISNTEKLLETPSAILTDLQRDKENTTHPSPTIFSDLTTPQASGLKQSLHENRNEEFLSSFKLKQTNKFPRPNCSSPNAMQASLENHNLLATGVLQSADTSTSFSGSSSSTFLAKDENSGSTGILRPMSRLLADLDNFSTDSYDEPWDVRHVKVLAQLTSSRFIDPSEVLSEVVGSNFCHDTPPQDIPRNSDTRLCSMTPTDSGVTSPIRKIAFPPPAVDDLRNTNRSKVKSPSIYKFTPSVHKVNPQTMADICAENLNSLLEQPWFHPSFTRLDAETCLQNEPEGSFLVRNSETNKNDFSLTIKHAGFLHMKISRNSQGKYVLGEYSQPYSSIPEMIFHYKQTRVPVKGADSVTLCYPR